MPRSSRAVVLLSLLSACLAVKDATYYPDGVVNPNVRRKMYWNDAWDVIQDLDQFSALYVRFHSCAWSPFLGGERKDDRVDETDYWYMNAMPDYGPNVAFSLYGTLAVSGGGGDDDDDSSSPCGKGTYINSFYSTAGLAGFTGSLSSSLSNVPNSATQYPTGCEDAVQLVCGANPGRSPFAVAQYSSGSCDPENMVSLSVPSDLAALNRALTKEAQCARIYSGGNNNAVPSLLKYSRACSLRDAVGACPDPFGRKSMYERELARAMSGNSPQSVLLGLALCVAGLGMIVMAALLVLAERRRAAEAKQKQPVYELPRVTQKQVRNDKDDNESCKTISTESDDSIEGNLRCFDRIVEAVADSEIDMVCGSLTPGGEGDHQCFDQIVETVEDSDLDKVCSSIAPCDAAAVKVQKEASSGRSAPAAKSAKLTGDMTSSASCSLQEPYAFSIGKKSVTLKWSSAGTSPIKRSFDEVWQNCHGGNENEVASDDSYDKTIYFHGSSDDDSLVHSVSSVPNDDETSFDSLSDDTDAAQGQKAEPTRSNTGNILAESSSEETGEQWVAELVYPPSKRSHVDSAGDCGSTSVQNEQTSMQGQSAKKGKGQSHDKKWLSMLRLTAKKKRLSSAPRQEPKRITGPPTLQDPISTFSTPIPLARMHFSDKVGLIINQNHRHRDQVFHQPKPNYKPAQNAALGGAASPRVTVDVQANSPTSLSHIVGAVVIEVSAKNTLFPVGFNVSSSSDSTEKPVRTQSDITGNRSSGSFRLPSFSLPEVKVQWPFAVENVNDDPSLYRIASTVFDSEPVSSAASDDAASYIAVEALSGTNAALTQEPSVAIEPKVAEAEKKEITAWFSGIFDRKKVDQPQAPPGPDPPVSGYALMSDGSPHHNQGSTPQDPAQGSDEAFFVPDWSEFDAPSAGPSAFV